MIKSTAINDLRIINHLGGISWVQRFRVKLTANRKTAEFRILNVEGWNRFDVRYSAVLCFINDEPRYGSREATKVQPIIRGLRRGFKNKQVRQLASDQFNLNE